MQTPPVTGEALLVVRLAGKCKRKNIGKLLGKLSQEDTVWSSVPSNLQKLHRVRWCQMGSQSWVCYFSGLHLLSRNNALELWSLRLLAAKAVRAWHPELLPWGGGLGTVSDCGFQRTYAGCGSECCWSSSTPLTRRAGNSCAWLTPFMHYWKTFSERCMLSLAMAHHGLLIDLKCDNVAPTIY